MWACCCDTSGDKADSESNAGKRATKGGTQKIEANEQDASDYEDLRYLAQARDIRCTIRKSTQAGVAAGLSVMAGTVIAGPVGAAVGGAVGTALATSLAKDVVPLNVLLEKPPPGQRHEVLKAFHAIFKEEFKDTIQSSPELKLLLRGRSIFGVVRYMVERDLIEGEKLEKLDRIMSLTKKVF